MLKGAIVAGVLAIPAVALAHQPIWIAYATRGECEARLAKDNIFHSKDKVSTGEYDNNGEGMREMHAHFWCERNPDDGLWYMLRIPF